MKKSSVFEWHRRFKEGREDVQDDPRSGQPKTQRTDANMDRVRTLVHSDQILGVRVTAEELNMNRETVRQIVKKIWEWENFPLKWWLESWHMARNNVGFTFHLIFYAMHRCLIGSLPVMKRGVFNTTRKQNDRACSGKKTEFTSAEQSTLVSVAGQDHACVFHRSQGDRFPAKCCFPTMC